VFAPPAASLAEHFEQPLSLHIKDQDRFSIQGLRRKRNAPYIPAMAMVTSSIVNSNRLTMASGVGGFKMK
jgi:hypothetical protein